MIIMIEGFKVGLFKFMVVFGFLGDRKMVVILVYFSGNYWLLKVEFVFSIFC